MPREAEAGTPIDQAVAYKAYYQHGLVTLQQLFELGVSRAMLRTRLDRGQWAKVEKQVVRIEGAKNTWESKLLARILGAGDGAMASHRSAAALWNLDGFPRRSRHELVVPNTRRIVRRDVTVHHSGDLHLVRPALRDHIPVTPLVRTLLDLAAVESREAVLLTVDDARRSWHISFDQLLRVLETHARRGRGGVATFRSIIDEYVDEMAVTESGFERLVISLLIEAGLPKPALQHEVRLGDVSYRLDLAYLNEQVAVELDGRVHLSEEVWERDHVRHARLTNAGWHVLAFTWRKYRRQPAFIVREVKTALARRGSLCTAQLTYRGPHRSR